MFQRTERDGQGTLAKMKYENARPSIVGLWGARACSDAESAEFLLATLRQLEAVAPFLAGWRPKQKSLDEAPQPDYSLASVESLLADVEQRAERVGGITRLGGWNGNEENPATFRVGYGYEGDAVCNAFNLILPPPHSKTGDLLYGRETLSSLFDVVVDVWKPSWAHVSDDHTREFGVLAEVEGIGVAGRFQRVGWLTYVDRSDGLGATNGKLFEASPSIESTTADSLTRTGNEINELNQSSAE